MTQIVTVSPGQSNVVASGPQFGVKYTLTGPDGSRAVFNDSTDADYIGWLTDLTGLDSPDLRESADDLIGEDGGVHGDFFHGRRPVVLEGQIDNRPALNHWRYASDGTTVVPFDATEVRNIRATALQRVTNAMRRDLTMRWAPQGGVDQVLYCRRQQPLRITGAFNKTFQAALVAADYRIYGAAIKETYFTPNVSTGSVTNDGTTTTPPVFTIYGPATNIQLHNISTGKYLRLATTYSITAGEYIVLDTNNKTIIKNGNTDIYGQLLFATSQWWGLEPGVNNVEWTATGTTGASSMVVRWQDAWV